MSSIWWRTDVPDDSLGYIPPQWRPAVDANEMIELSIILRTDGRPGMPFVEATANGHTVTYRPSTEGPPRCR